MVAERESCAGDHDSCTNIFWGTFSKQKGRGRRVVKRGWLDVCHDMGASRNRRRKEVT